MRSRLERISEWSVARAAVISLDGKPSDKGFQAALGDVEVRSIRPLTKDGEPLGTLVVATVSLPGPPNLTEPFDVGTIVDQRQQAESAIEQMARLLAIDMRCTHGLSSPMPCVGLLCSETENLHEADGLEVVGAGGRAKQGGVGAAGLFDEGRAQALSDRPDGVALLAEALNGRTAFGKYTQLMRLFERAFKLGPWAVTEPLAQFLAGSKHQFTPDEVDAWTQARAPAIHADRREDFFLEADLRPFELRMMEAGYDVLMNKEVWRDKSTARRDLWTPDAGSSDDQGGIFITKGKPASLNFVLTDDFGAYPMLLASGHKHLLPTGLWITARGEGRALALLEQDLPE